MMSHGHGTHGGHNENTVRLARQEEREAIAEFGDAYVRYAKKTPAFFPYTRPSQHQIGKHE
jgi:hypothetical protein